MWLLEKKTYSPYLIKKAVGRIWGHLMASNDRRCSQASESTRTRNCVSPSPTLHLIDAQSFYGEILQFTIDWGTLWNFPFVETPGLAVWNQESVVLKQNWSEKPLASGAKIDWGVQADPAAYLLAKLSWESFVAQRLSFPHWKVRIIKPVSRGTLPAT